LQACERRPRMQRPRCKSRARKRYGSVSRAGRSGGGSR
jgi:hypothetical protein